MRRRTFITLLGSAAAAWPLAAQAQQPKMLRVGFVGMQPREKSGRHACARHGVLVVSARTGRKTPAARRNGWLVARACFWRPIALGSGHQPLRPHDARTRARRVQNLAAKMNNEPVHCFIAIELSKSGWVVGFQTPLSDKTSRYQVKAGDANGLLELIERVPCGGSAPGWLYAACRGMGSHIAAPVLTPNLKDDFVFWSSAPGSTRSST